MQLRGVNLGGWLLLERWITPSLFAGTNAQDEYSFCAQAPSEATAKLQHHRETYITEQDFKWLAEHGVNAIRISVGYWALESDPPFVQCVDVLDQAFAWAAKYNLHLLLDLHGAPGSQNGQDHSGKASDTSWNRQSNINRTLEVLNRLCERYGKQPALYGVELLNEPGWKVPLRTLRSFYDKGYDVVRQYCSERVAVIVSDAFKPLAWNDFLANPKYKNLTLDMHLYQCFGPHDKALSLEAHIEKARHEWATTITSVARPVIVGEWSLGLDGKTFTGMSDSQKTTAIASYAQAQLDGFGNAQGWFFWSYKTEDMPGWSYRASVESGVWPK